MAQRHADVGLGEEWRGEGGGGEEGGEGEALIRGGGGEALLRFRHRCFTLKVLRHPPRWHGGMWVLVGHCILPDSCGMVAWWHGSM